MKTGAAVPRRSFNRRYGRKDVQGCTFDIADGRFIASGTVDNISCNGLKVSQLAPAFHAEKLMYTAVVSGRGRSFRVLVKPCWQKAGATGLEMGFKVIEASWEWLEFADPSVPVYFPEAAGTA